MDGVGTPIIGRPRPLPSHDTPNPAHNTYTLKCEEPDWQPGQGHWKPGDKPPKFSRKEMKKAIEKRVEELAAESKERVNRRYSSH